MNISKIIESILWLGLAFALLFGIIRRRKAYKKCTEAVQAVFAGTGNYIGRSLGCAFFFSYDYQGKHYEKNESMSTKIMIASDRNKHAEKLGYTIGQQYTIHVDPENPKNYIAEIRSSFFFEWYAFAGCLLAAVLTLLQMIMQ